MHSGSLNRGIEISHAVADSPAGVILDQVTNGPSEGRTALFGICYQEPYNGLLGMAMVLGDG